MFKNFMTGFLGNSLGIAIFFLTWFVLAMEATYFWLAFGTIAGVLYFIDIKTIDFRSEIFRLAFYFSPISIWLSLLFIELWQVDFYIATSVNYEWTGLLLASLLSITVVGLVFMIIGKKRNVIN